MNPSAKISADSSQNKRKRISPTPDEYIKSYSKSLREFCTEHKLGIPMFDVATESDSENRKSFICYCTAIINFNDVQHFFEAASTARSLKLANEQAARQMYSWIRILVKPLVKRTTQVKEKAWKKVEEKFEWKVHKIDAEISEKIEEDHARSKETIIRWINEVASQSINKSTNQEQTKLSPKYSVLLDSDSDEEEETNSVNLYADRPLSKCRRKLNPIRKPLNQPTPVNNGLRSCQKDVSPKEKIDSCDPTNVKKISPQLSEFHQTMLNIFGHDMRSDIAQKLHDLFVSVMSSGRCHEIDFIDRQLVHLDEIMTLIDVEVHNTVYNADDGRFIRSIYVTTIPEIVKTAQAPHLGGLGVNEFLEVVEKLKKMMI